MANSEQHINKFYTLCSSLEPLNSTAAGSVCGLWMISLNVQDDRENSVVLQLYVVVEFVFFYERKIALIGLRTFLNNDHRVVTSFLPASISCSGSSSQTSRNISQFIK